MTLLTRIAREPLLHFLLIGLVIFLVYARLNAPEADAAPANQIEVSLADVAQLVSQFEGTWRRKPTRDELDSLIETHIRESILVEEALSLSMDKDDAVINRRLTQKMAFLMESAAGAVPPTDEDLRAYYTENAANYASAPLVAFEQVFFGEAPDAAEVDAALVALTDGADPATMGHQTLLPPAFPLSPEVAIDGSFGRGFFQTLADQEVGMWAAPVRSGFGLHAVRIIERIPGQTPEFETVRDRVTDDYIAATGAELAETLYAEMRARYAVSLPEATELESVLQ